MMALWGYEVTAVTAGVVGMVHIWRGDTLMVMNAHMWAGEYWAIAPGTYGPIIEGEDRDQRVRFDVRNCAVQPKWKTL